VQRVHGGRATYYPEREDTELAERFEATICTVQEQVVRGTVTIAERAGDQGVLRDQLRRELGASKLPFAILNSADLPDDQKALCGVQTNEHSCRFPEDPENERGLYSTKDNFLDFRDCPPGH
jgi:hypothetical protein